MSTYVQPPGQQRAFRAWNRFCEWIAGTERRFYQKMARENLVLSRARMRHFDKITASSKVSLTRSLSRVEAQYPLAS